MIVSQSHIFGRSFIKFNGINFDLGLITQIKNGIGYITEPTPRTNTYTILATNHVYESTIFKKKFLIKKSKKKFFLSNIGRFINQNVQNQILRNF